MSKKIVVLGTGGTIAGTSPSATDNVGYRAAQLEVGGLLQSVPGLAQCLGGHGVVTEQLADVDSKDMGWTQWRALAQRALHYLGQPDISAVLVTHGTDTLEESAYFLSRVLPASVLAHKPLVLTCAMRPASSMSADGPQNMRDAVRVACTRGAHGVLAVCAATVHAARDVQKVHPYRLDAFDSGDAGPLAYVEEGAVRWVHPCPAVGAQDVQWMDCVRESVWPRVEIVFSHAGADGALVRTLCATSPDAEPVRGLVIAATGNGTVHHALEVALLQAQLQGIRVVRSTRCAYGQIVPGDGAVNPFPAVGLSPVKARIALMLDLMR
ncbi:MAG: asparaginase [Burkholderiales bacterium]|nr:asparaginase [Burkholderiales bacterium]